MIAVLAAVLDDAHPRLALLEGFPHMGKYGGWHVRMAYQIVWRVHQLFTAETADINEHLIAVGDHALEVGRGNQALILGHLMFALSHGLVITHGKVPF